MSSNISSFAWVYPRACGGTPFVSFGEAAAQGLSPRMRGNRSRWWWRRKMMWSIPAHAGEPSVHGGMTDGVGVYPRACGGTPCDVLQSPHTHGLSPRMRGNPFHISKPSGLQGSIPAHAGEPLLPPRRGGSARVYPRACGGTERRAHEDAARQGLSPRMRGNRPACTQSHPHTGSIPAHAGEPHIVLSHLLVPWVYPRACGGTTPAFSSTSHI